MANTKLFIPVLAGTTRHQRKSLQVAKLITQIGEEIPNIKTRLIDPKDFNFPGDGNDPEGKDPRYTKITQQADGFFVVVPEYNHSFPGSLKRMLDSELKNYIHKPIAFAGVSSGPWGGVRAIEALVGAAREMGLVATFLDVQFPKVQEAFDEDGKLLSQEKIERVKGSWTELIWMAHTLKYGRDRVPSKFHEQ